MNAKKLMSLLTVICLIVSCFAGVVSAAEETELFINSLDKKGEEVDLVTVEDGDDVSVDFDKIKMEYYEGEIETIKAEIAEANVCDFNTQEKPYKEGSYKVSYEYDEEYADWCRIAIEAEELKIHKNGNQQDGYWVGFSVKVPEGAKKVKYLKTFGLNPYNYNTIDLGEDKEISFYLDAIECDKYDEWLELTWLDENEAEIADYVWYDIDLSAIKFAADDNKFDVANVCDSFPGEEAAPAKVYKDDTYTVAEKDGVIDIDMEELVLHKNANGRVGYWTGFSVKVPEGAKKLSYAKSYGDEPRHNTIDLGTDTEVSFYIDVEDWYSTDDSEEYVALQWLDAEGNAISRNNYYELDFDGVEIVYPDASKIGKANIADHADEPKAVLYKEDSYDVEVIGDAIVLKAEDLELHENGNNDEGAWIGFSVEAPEGVTHYEYSFGNSYTDEPVALEEGETSVSFYVNASSSEAKNEVGIRWYTSEDRPYSYYDEWYYIDITKVLLKGAEPVEVTPAVIADATTGETPYTGEFTIAENEGTVKLTVNDLKTHYNAQNKLGAWVGVKVSKPEGAANVKYVFAEENEAWWQAVAYESANVILDEDGEGVSFYVDAFDATPKNTIMIQWFDEYGVAMTNVNTYKLDLSGVDYKVENEAKMTVGKANIVDQAGQVENPASDDYKAELKDDTIVLSADIIKLHENANNAKGAWIGFEPAVEGAAYVKYVFVYPYEDNDWYDAGMVAAGESFYVDARDNDHKDEVTLQWFDEDGVALTNVNTYKIDVKDVEIERGFDFLYSKIELNGEDAGAYKLASDEHIEWVSTSDYVYVLAYAENGTVALSVEGEDESNGGNVFYRNTDRKVTVTATPDSGYKFTGWYEGEEKISGKASLELTLDACYELEARFEKGSSGDNTPSNRPGGGGGLTAGGDKSNTGADDLGAKDEDDKTEGTTTPSAPSFFADVPAGAWYYDVVKSAYDNGLMNGVSATTFAPSQSLTRGMFVTILYRLAGSPAVEAAAPFTDVPATQYYADAVAWASANGIVNGVSADKFAPNSNITREQMAAIIHRFATTSGIEAAGSSEVSYSDSAMISAFAKAAVEWATNAGILSGNSDGTFAPLRTATRAEAAAIFVRLLGLVK